MNREKKEAVVEGEQSKEVGFPSTINEASGTGGLEKGAEAVPREIPVALEPFGEALMDVHGIEFFNRQAVHHSIHGEISFITEYGDLYLFKRGKEDPQKILRPYGGGLSLVGPQYAIQAWDRLAFGVYLWEGEKQVVKGTVSWPGAGIYNDSMQLFDSPQCLQFLRDEARVFIHFVVYSNAVVANVEFKLRKRSKKNNTSLHNLHGTILSSNGMRCNVQTVLFNKKADESILVGNGDLIPLVRSVIAVPLHTSLDFEVYLPLISTNLLSCWMIACKDNGVDVKRISGKYGKVEVIVTWESYFDHSRRIKKLRED